MPDITEYKEEDFDVVESCNIWNNDIAQNIAHSVSRENNFEDANDMYIKELFDMKKKIKEVWDKNWWSANLIDQWRKVNNDIEAVVWIKKDKTALYMLQDIRQKWRDLYLN